MYSNAGLVDTTHKAQSKSGHVRYTVLQLRKRQYLTSYRAKLYPKAKIIPKHTTDSVMIKDGEHTEWLGFTAADILLSYLLYENFGGGCSGHKLEDYDL